MRLTTKVFAAVAATVIALATPLCAQNAEFAPVAPTTGTFVFNFTITASSALPKNGVVVCNATAFVNDAAGVTQKGTGIATLSAGKWLCKVTLPYSWALATATTDKVTLGYAVEIDYALQVTASNGTLATAQLVQLDKVNQNLASISVPLNGATTTETVSATI